MKIIGLMGQFIEAFAVPGKRVVLMTMGDYTTAGVTERIYGALRHTPSPFSGMPARRPSRPQSFPPSLPRTSQASWEEAAHNVFRRACRGDRKHHGAVH